jgi:uncharacterized repeat protein (TIGR01451 family)
MRTGGQRGASGLFILVILIFVALTVLAVIVLDRANTANQDRNATIANLTKAIAALDAFAGASARLPCPANPVVDDGVEVTATSATCSYPQGTLPWKTLGMRRDDAYDAWGHKLSYRVYTNNAGSLTQPGGASMADCDLHEAFPGGTTGIVGGSGGLCKSNHTTTPDQFLKPPNAAKTDTDKGFTLNDFGAAQSHVAYVVISHGITGLGSYTSSGIQLDLPKGDELANTRSDGPFIMRPFSETDTAVDSNLHFDDLLAYRTISDLAQVSGLAARNWADNVLSAITFDKDTLTAALGANPSSDTGKSTIAFNNATVSAFDSGGEQDISYVNGGGRSDAIGGVNGGDGLLGSSGGEGLRIDFPEDARQFAFTVDQFDDSSSVHERLELRFYKVVNNTVTLKATQVESSCSSNGEVTSFSLDACAAFNRIEIRPLTTTDGTSDSSLSLAEIRTCVDGVPCVTDLQSTGNVCSTKSFAPCSMAVGDSSTLNITLTNSTGSDMTAAAFTDPYPPGLVNIASPVIGNTCGGVVTGSSGGSSLALSNGLIPHNSYCTVSIGVTAPLPGVYGNSTSNVTTATSTLAAVSGTLLTLLQPAVAIEFSPTSISTGGTSVHTITLTNSNTYDIVGVAFDEVLPPELAAVEASAGTTCSGAVTASNGANAHVKLATGVIPASSSCTVSAIVTSGSIGTYTASIMLGAVVTANAGKNISGATATLSVH